MIIVPATPSPTRALTPTLTPTITITIILSLCSGCAPSPRQGLDPLREMPTYAVTLSDRTSTAIALLDRRGEVLHSAWIHSGTTVPGLVAALSGDVVLPSTPGPGDELTLIDRFRADVLTQIDLRNAEIIGQLRVHATEHEDSTFSSNPYDVVHDASSASLAWVTRFGVGRQESSPSSADLGNDLLEFDTGSMTLTGRQIDLATLNTDIHPGASGLPVAVTAYARPSLAILVNGYIVIGLARLSLAFEAAAEGLIAVADPSTSRVQGFAIEGLANCGRVVPVPNSTSLVLVSCVGFSRPYGNVEDLRRNAGLAIVRILDGTDASVVRIWRAQDHPESPLAVEGAIAFDETTVLATAFGYGASEKDRFYRLDLSTGHATLIFESGGAFDVGIPSFDRETRLILVPDVGTGLRRFELVGDEVIALPTLDLGIEEGLPPREVYRL